MDTASKSTVSAHGAVVPLHLNRYPTYEKDRGPTPGDYITWIHKDGQAKYSVDPTEYLIRSFGSAQPDALMMGTAYRLPSLADRRYLQEIIAGNFQRVRDDGLKKVNYKKKNGKTFSAAETDSCFFDMLRVVQNSSILRKPSYHENIPLLKALLARPSRDTSLG